MTVSGGQVQRRVVTSVGGVDAGASLHEHFDDFQMTLLGRPMQRAESVIVPTTRHGVNTGRLECEKHKCSPLVHVVFGVVQPDPDLHGVSFAAPLKYVFHFCGETDVNETAGKSVGSVKRMLEILRTAAVASSLKHTKFGNTKINRLISATAVFATNVINSDNGGRVR